MPQGQRSRVNNMRTARATTAYYLIASLALAAGAPLVAANAQTAAAVSESPALPPQAPNPVAIGTEPQASAALPTVPEGDAGALPVAPPSASDQSGQQMLSPAELAAELLKVRSSKTLSFGDSNISIFYSSEQTELMKKALTSFETRPIVSDVKPKINQPVKLDAFLDTPKTLDEPQKYPVFYLSSIVYRSPKDWSLWVSGHKITSAKNTTDLTVTKISKDEVSFSWTPAYVDALNKRQEQNRFADTATIKNLLSRSQNVAFDKTTGMVTFTLRSNQTFAVAYFSIFEGYMSSPDYEAAQAAPTPGDPMLSIPGISAPANASQLRDFAKPQRAGATQAVQSPQT